MNLWILTFNFPKHLPFCRTIVSFYNSVSTIINSQLVAVPLLWFLLHSVIPNFYWFNSPSIPPIPISFSFLCFNLMIITLIFSYSLPVNSVDVVRKRRRLKRKCWLRISNLEFFGQKFIGPKKKFETETFLFQVLNRSCSEKAH